MALCSMNLTIGVYSYAPTELIDIKDNVIVGVMGKIYDNYMVHRGKRDCKFSHIYYFKEEEKETNDTVNAFSANYLMRKNRLDFYSRPKPIGYIKSHLEMTKTASIDS